MVKATMKMPSETSIRMMPRPAPGVPGSTACGG